ncbi:MAG TPA: STAS domain-containing protein, partial [Planctomycetota bacterium]|nr:STAS domain-containing protein [Planctomycetota bacterium]
HNVPVNRDELFISLALRAKFITPAQVEDCRKIRDMLAKSGLAPLLPEILAKQEFLSPAQVRILSIATRYEELKLDDEDLADYLVRKGHLDEVKASACLEIQQDPFNQGAAFPRLEDLLIQRGYLTPQELAALLRVRNVAKPVQPPATETGKADPPPRSVSPKLLKALEAGLKQETLKIAFRKARIVDDLYAAVLELSGSLDGHTSIRFDEYLQAITSAGFAHLILDCGKLDYISSAGIGVLAATIKRCRDGKGDIRLCSVEDKMRRVMQIIGLLSLMRTYENEKAAVASFRSA